MSYQPETLSRERAIQRQLAALNPCTRDPGHGPAEVPWAGERLCWNCADADLDLLAKALLSEDGPPVQVGTSRPPIGHVATHSLEQYR